MLNIPDTTDLQSDPPEAASNGRHSPPNGTAAGIAGRYTYRRVFHDERILELLPDGTIGEGLGRAEMHWHIKPHATGDILQIGGDHGVICELRQDPDGVWRGRWASFERMPIELYPRHSPIPPMPEFSTGITMDDTQFHFVSYAQFLADVKALAQQLPPLRAVVGNPRSGILPASIIAGSQNVPLLPLDEVLFSDQPHLPVLRRRAINDRTERRPILIVDDTVYSGRQFAYLRSRVKTSVLWAAVYVDPGALHLVDFHNSPHLPVPQSYEWTLLHDFNCYRMLCDLDGVICEDWHGDEEADPQKYRDHVENARPLRIPSQPILAVVTGRLERYREPTVRWLARHGVRYGHLHMFPGRSVAARSQLGAAAYKARIFEYYRQAFAFIESCPAQSQCIHGITGRPVIDFTSMKLLSRD